MGRLALVDADLLKYRAGFAAQKEIWTHVSIGERFEGKTAAKDWCKEFLEQDLNPEEWEMKLDVKPWEGCKRIIDNSVGEILHHAKCDDVLMCISPATCFRDKIAITKKYKGSRKPHRPEHADNIVKYFMSDFDYEVGDNVEADDVMGMRQSHTTVIASYDKDMDMIAGAHYNFKDGEFYYQDPQSADERFYTQLMAGDSTDDILGIPGIGEAKARKIVELYQDDQEELVDHIRMLYEEAYPNKYTDQTPEKAIQEMAALVWILRSGETPETAGWRKLIGVEDG